MICEATKRGEKFGGSVPDEVFAEHNDLVLANDTRVAAQLPISNVFGCGASHVLTFLTWILRT